MNLLKQDDVDAIVNAVNRVGVMGEGIALQFKNKWPANFFAGVAADIEGFTTPFTNLSMTPRGEL